MRLVRTIAWEYRMIIDYDHHWYFDMAENQLLENVERSQLEMLSSHVAQRVRAFHHLRPIVIDPSLFSLFVFFYQPPQIICIVLLAPSGALIAIPTYYWSTTHPTTHFFRSHRSSTLDFHFLSHYSYIKGNHWTHQLAICIPCGYNRTSLQDSAR